MCPAGSQRKRISFQERLWWPRVGRRMWDRLRQPRSRVQLKSISRSPVARLRRSHKIGTAASGPRLSATCQRAYPSRANRPIYRSGLPVRRFHQTSLSRCRRRLDHSHARTHQAQEQATGRQLQKQDESSSLPRKSGAQRFSRRENFRGMRLPGRSPHRLPYDTSAAPRAPEGSLAFANPAGSGTHSLFGSVVRTPG